jgi:hypothetical protein
MPQRRLRTVAIAVCACSVLIAAGARAEPALVEVGNLVLRADGGFKPRALPKRHFAPIDFHGRVEVAAKNGGHPSALEGAIIDFDRDGRFTPGTLPACAPEAVSDASPEQARQLCGGAIVGSGHVRVSIALPGGPVQTGSALTLFNGPRREGEPTVVLHTQITVPATQTLTTVVPIERRRGRFRFRATLAIPPIAGGLGSLTHLDVTVGRRFNVDGQPRSYLAARCADGVIQTHGRFTFADGTAVDGSVERSCDVR